MTNQIQSSHQTLKILNLLTFSFMLFGVLVFSCKPKENTQNGVSNLAISPKDTITYSPEIIIDLEKELKNTPPQSIQTVDVLYDHFFKTKKQFKGFPLRPLLDSVAKSVHFDTTGALVIFECKDGYNPQMDWSKVMNTEGGYIVFKDVSQAKNWADSITALFNPYYVTWADVKKEDNSYMWPYGLVKIHLKSSALEYHSIYPAQNPKLVKGFQLFRQTCMKCHALNKVGGSMGPEFNLPKNITEYWTEENIIAFAKSPKQFRYNSTMPAVTELSDADFHEIIAYLKGLRGQ